MFDLGARIIHPDSSRQPTQDSVNNPKGYLRFRCQGCTDDVLVEPRSYSSRYSDPETVLGPERECAVRDHFGLPSSISWDSGWPKLRIESCPSCYTNYLVCLMEKESQNGWFQWTVRGVTALVTRTAA